MSLDWKDAHLYLVQLVYKDIDNLLSNKERLSEMIKTTVEQNKENYQKEIQYCLTK